MGPGVTVAAQGRQTREIASQSLSGIKIGGPWRHFCSPGTPNASLGLQNLYSRFLRKSPGSTCSRFLIKVRTRKFIFRARIGGTPGSHPKNRYFTSFPTNVIPRCSHPRETASQSLSGIMIGGPWRHFCSPHAQSTRNSVGSHEL